MWIVAAVAVFFLGANLWRHAMTPTYKNYVGGCVDRGGLQDCMYYFDAAGQERAERAVEEFIEKYASLIDAGEVVMLGKFDVGFYDYFSSFVSRAQQTHNVTIRCGRRLSITKGAPPPPEIREGPMVILNLELPAGPPGYSGVE